MFIIAFKRVRNLSLALLKTIKPPFFQRVAKRYFRQGKTEDQSLMLVTNYAKNVMDITNILECDSV